MPGVWDAIDLTIFMPFWNRSVSPAFLDYTVILGGTWVDANTRWSDMMFRVAELQWLNKCNPDWYNLVNSFPSPLGALSGEGFYFLDDLASCSIEVDDSHANIDKWWGSDQIGKYGVVSPMVGLYIKQPLTFINCKKNMVIIEDEGWDGLYYNFQPGVTASGVAGQYGHHLYGSSKTPPIYWYCPWTDGYPFYNLTGGHSPYSVYGPEHLP